MFVELIILKLFLAGCVFFSALVAGCIPFYDSKTIHQTIKSPYMELFVAGIFLSGGLIHLWSHVTTLFIKSGLSSFLGVAICVFFLAILIVFDFYLPSNMKLKTNPQYSRLLTPVLAVLYIHSFLAGVSLGGLQKHSLILLMGVAILSHKWIVSFALSVWLTYENHQNFKLNLLLWMIFCIMTPLGILTGAYLPAGFENKIMISALINALASAIFIYLGGKPVFSAVTERSVTGNKLGLLSSFLFGCALVALALCL